MQERQSSREYIVNDCFDAEINILPKAQFQNLHHCLQLYRCGEVHHMLLIKLGPEIVIT